MKIWIVLLLAAGSLWGQGWTGISTNATDPPNCSLGGLYMNSTTLALRLCTAPGTFSPTFGAAGFLGTNIYTQAASGTPSGMGWFNNSGPLWKLQKEFDSSSSGILGLVDVNNSRTIWQSTPGAISELEAPKGIAAAVGTTLFPAWNSSTTYNLGDRASAGGINYTAGGPGYYCLNGGLWSSLQTYALGDCVSTQSGATVTGYISLQASNLNHSPSSSPSYWTNLGSSTTGSPPNGNVNQTPPNSNYWLVFNPALWAGSGIVTGEFSASYGAAPTVAYLVNGSQSSRVTTNSPAMTLGSIAYGTMYPYVGELNIISDRLPVPGSVCPFGESAGGSAVDPTCTLGFGETIYVAGSPAGYQTGGLIVNMVQGAGDGFVTNLECQLFSSAGICGSEVDIGNKSGTDGAGNGDYGSSVFSYGFDMQGQGGNLNAAAIYINADSSSAFKHGIDFLNGSIAPSGSWGTGYAIVLPNNIWVSARNAASNAFEPMFKVDTTPNLQIGGSGLTSIVLNNSVTIPNNTAISWLDTGAVARNGINLDGSNNIHIGGTGVGAVAINATLTTGGAINFGSLSGVTEGLAVCIHSNGLLYVKASCP